MKPMQEANSTSIAQIERIEATRDLSTLSFIVANGQMEDLVARFPEGHFFANSTSDYLGSYGYLAGRKLRVVSQIENEEATAAWEIFNPLVVDVTGSTGNHLAPDCSISSVFCAAQKAPTSIVEHAAGIAGHNVVCRVGAALIRLIGADLIPVAEHAAVEGAADVAAGVDAERARQIREATQAEIEAGLRARGIIKQAPRRLPNYMFAAHFAGATYGTLTSAKTIVFVCGAACSAYYYYNYFMDSKDGSNP